MKIKKIRNNTYYDKTFFGISVTLEPEEQEIDQEKFEILNKNCPNFQQMTNPPEHGGTPRIRVLGSTPSGDVRLNAEGVGEPTMFTAPAVRLRGDDITGVPKDMYNKLQDDNRFKKLVDAGELVPMEGWEEK